MLRRNRFLSTTLIVGLLVSCIAGQAYAVQNSKEKKTSDGPAGKEIIGKWQGGATTDGESDTLEVTLELRLDGSRITGDVHADTVEMKVTNVDYANGSWLLSCVSPDGQEAKINCSIKSGKLIGEWTYGGNTGKFEFARTTSSPK